MTGLRDDRTCDSFCRMKRRQRNSGKKLKSTEVQFCRYANYSKRWKMATTVSLSPLVDSRWTAESRHHLLVLHLETVAHARNSNQQLGFTRIGFDLFAQVSYVNAQSRGFFRIIEVPNFAQELAVG